MTRKDWFYAQLPIVMAQALDEIIEKRTQRYGLDDRSELIRLIIGRFIMQCDQNSDEVRKFLEEVTGKILEDNNNNTKSSSYLDKYSSNSNSKKNKKSKTHNIDIII